MTKYKFKYKRKFFWRSYEVVGHNLDNDSNVMTIFFENGSLMTIPKWGECSLSLGVDWALAVRKNAEAQTGVELKTNIKA